MTRLEWPVNWSELSIASARDFRAYFDGASQVGLASLDAVGAWLRQCEYVSDQTHNQCVDHWQHPLNFESERRGDCEDFALWGWRKIADLGLAVEFVLGLLEPKPGDPLANHAWLHVHDGKNLVLIETTARQEKDMIRAIDQEGRRYLPTASIDHQMRTYYFANYFHERRLGRPLRV